MRTAALVILGVVATAGAARGGDGPLLVSVEIAPGADVSPSEVRRVIAAELGTAVVAAGEPAAASAGDVLLVTVDAREVRMSLRAGAAPVVARAIAAPGDRPARLRSIGWLAGNLARDQVGPLVAIASPLAAAVSAPPAPTEPPAMPVAAPPPFDAATPVAVVVSESSPKANSDQHARWSVTALGGPTMNVFHNSAVGETYFMRGTAFQAEVHHQSSPDSLLFGAALEIGPDQPARHYFGVAALVGSGWYRRSWFVEGTLGLGIEELDGLRKTTTVTNSSSQLGTQAQTTISLEPIPGLFVRPAGVAGVRVSSSFDLVAQLGAHFSTTGQVGSFASATAGLRLRLP